MASEDILDPEDTKTDQQRVTTCLVTAVSAITARKEGNRIEQGFTEEVTL